MVIGRISPLRAVQGVIGEYISDKRSAFEDGRFRRWNWIRHVLQGGVGNVCETALRAITKGA